MIPREVIDNVRYGVCSIGLLTKTDEEIDKDNRASFFEIVGSGFLIRSDVVITNRHVLIALTQRYERLKATTCPHVKRAIQFTYLRDQNDVTSDIGQCYVGPKWHLMIGNADHDLALFHFDRKTPDPDFERLCQPLNVVESVADIRIGEEVGVMGFPYGDLLHVDARLDPTRISRLGPLLQHGYISGVQPVEGQNVLNDLFLDVRVINGLSGSPVFRQQTGDVIGVVYGGMKVPLDVGGKIIPIPASVVGKAVPLDKRRVAAFLQALDRREKGPVMMSAQY